MLGLFVTAASITVIYTLIILLQSCKRLLMWKLSISAWNEPLTSNLTKYSNYLKVKFKFHLFPEYFTNNWGNIDLVFFLPYISFLICCNKLHKLGSPKCIPSQFWRPEFFNQYHLSQGVCRVAPPLEALGENLFFASFTMWWLLAFLDLWPHQSHLQGQHLQFSLWSVLTLPSLCVDNLLLLPLINKDSRECV